MGHGLEVAPVIPRPRGTLVARIALGGRDRIIPQSRGTPFDAERPAVIARIIPVLAGDILARM